MLLKLLTRTVSLLSTRGIIAVWVHCKAAEARGPASEITPQLLPICSSHSKNKYLLLLPVAECYGQILRTPELNSIWSTVNAILWIFPRGYCPQICRARRPAPLLALPFDPRGCSRQLGRPTSKYTSGSHLDILVNANRALLWSYTRLQRRFKRSRHIQVWWTFAICNKR